MCGEKIERLLAAKRRLGSPPHVRGKGISSPNSIKDGGITPACVGKSRTAGCYRLIYWDHPRMCGEKSVYSCLFNHI